MEKIWALIRNNTVENVIVAEEAFIATIQSQWDACVRIDELNPRPGMYWTYVAGIFTAPLPGAEPEE